MKKVDLTTLDICSVIVNRVESMPQSTDYLVFGAYEYAGRLRIYISVPLIFLSTYLTKYSE